MATDLVFLVWSLYKGLTELQYSQYIFVHMDKLVRIGKMFFETWIELNVGLDTK